MVFQSPVGETVGLFPVQLWTRVQVWVFIWTYVFISHINIISGIVIVWLLDVFSSLRASELFSQLVITFYTWADFESSSSSTSLSTLGLICSFSQYSRSIGVSYCGLNLNFPNTNDTEMLSIFSCVYLPLMYLWCPILCPHVFFWSEWSQVSYSQRADDLIKG